MAMPVQQQPQQAPAPSFATHAGVYSGSDSSSSSSSSSSDDDRDQSDYEYRRDGVDARPHFVIEMSEEKLPDVEAILQDQQPPPVRRPSPSLLCCCSSVLPQLLKRASRLYASCASVGVLLCYCPGLLHGV